MTGTYVQPYFFEEDIVAELNNNHWTEFSDIFQENYQVVAPEPVTVPLVKIPATTTNFPPSPKKSAVKKTMVKRYNSNSSSLTIRTDGLESCNEDQTPPQTPSSHQRTSMEIFLQYVISNGDGTCDASGILSKNCFDEWLRSRKTEPKNPFLTYVHTVRSHVTGDPKTGRNPFSEEIESSLLVLLRKKEVWPCFVGTQIRYGIRGMYVTGYHEARRTAANPAFPTIRKDFPTVSPSNKPTKKRLRTKKSSDSSTTSAASTISTVSTSCSEPYASATSIIAPAVVPYSAVHQQSWYQPQTPMYYDMYQPVSGPEHDFDELMDLLTDPCAPVHQGYGYGYGYEMAPVEAKPLRTPKRQRK